MDQAFHQQAATEELAFIRNIIEQSRRGMTENGIPYIVWGLTIAIGAFVNYLQIILNIELYTGFVWMGLILLALGGTSWSVRKSKRSKQPESYGEKLQGAIWGVCGSVIGLEIIVLISGAQMPINEYYVSPIFLYPLTSLILGIAYFLAGFVLDLKWLRNLGFVWWLGFIAMFYMHSIHVMAVYAGMLLLFEVVPGIILFRMHKKLSNTSAGA